MKKSFKTMVVAACVCAVGMLTLALAGCGAKEAEGTAYGTVHNYYVGMVTVTRAGDKVKNVQFEEMEGPASWAKKTNIAEGKQADVAFTTGGFAKQIAFGELTFTATDDENTKTPGYKQSGSDVTFEKWAKDDTNAKTYFEQMRAGSYSVLKSDGTKVEGDFNVAKNDLKKGERWLKSKNGYWSGENFPLGWQGNMNKMKDYLIRNGFGAYKGSEQKDETWIIDGVDTGATLVDFHDYMKLAKSAFEKAM